MASSTYMTLVNTLLRRLNEVEIEQADFAAARGVQAMAKDAINASMEQIQQAEFTWPFNAVTGSQVLVAGTETYAWPANLKIVDWESFHISKDDAIDENGRSLKYIPRAVWLKRRKQTDDYAGSAGLSPPAWVFPGHVNGFGVSPSPDKAYTVTYDYFKLHTTPTLYNSTTTIPTTYDEVIIQGALYHFYMFRDNPEHAKLAEKRFEDQLKDMRILLINKPSRITDTMIVHTRRRGQFGIPVDGAV